MFRDRLGGFAVDAVGGEDGKDGLDNNACGREEVTRVVLVKLACVYDL